MLKSSQPAHLRVLDKLTQAIESGRLSPDSFLPSEREIAEEYGVSRPTVRRALDELVRSGCIIRGEGKRPRVLPKAAAQKAERGKQNHVALISCVPFSAVVQGENSDLSNIVASAIQGFEPAGFHVTYMNTYGRTLETERQMQELIAPFYGGIMFLPPGRANAGALRALANAHCPSVIVSGYVEPLGGRVHTVDRDDVRGGALATSHLIEQGSREIVHVTYAEDLPWVERRIRGYREELQRAGKRRERIVKPFGFADLPMDQRVRTLAEHMPAKVDAVFAANDAMADVVYRWAETSGRTVGKDLSIVGFDNVAKAVERSLTTVSHMSAELGTRAMEVLCEAMQDDAPRIARRETIEPILVVRSSVVDRRTASARRKAVGKNATNKAKGVRTR